MRITSLAALLLATAPAFAEAPYPVPDTMQTACFDTAQEIACPAADEALYGQDAQFALHPANYTDNGDGTVTDNVTGLMWAKSPDLNGDGAIKADDKLSYEAALAAAPDFTLAGFDDWRVPTIKEMYSLMDFRGIDPSGYEGDDLTDLIPFIDRTYFDFGYGDTSAEERIIDAQMVSTTLYVSNTYPNAERTLFGVNFADGRIKGYQLNFFGRDKTFYVMFVRGDPGYGVNEFASNGDGTITDASTGLMWTQADSGEAMDWLSALAWVAARNTETYLGHTDWRLPDVKELQGIVDYSRSPDTTNSPAIDPIFETTEITNEAGQVDYPWVWSSTTHANWTQRQGNFASYVSFGRAMGYMREAWGDVHGAGAQRSDPKTGDAAEYPEGHGPQGDAIRIKNFVRLVRDADSISQ